MNSALDFLQNKFFSFDKPLEDTAAYETRKILNHFSVALVEYRIAHGMTQTALAKRLGVSQPMVSQYEAGTNNITIQKLCELSENIGMRVRVTVEPIEPPETALPYAGLFLEEPDASEKMNLTAA